MLDRITESTLRVSRQGDRLTGSFSLLVLDGSLGVISLAGFLKIAVRPKGLTMPKHDTIYHTAKDQGRMDFLKRKMPSALQHGIEDDFRIAHYHTGYIIEEKDHEELRRLGYFGITTN